MSASEKTDDESGNGLETVNSQGDSRQIPDEGHPVPLFLRDRNDGPKGNAQDEKDEMGE